MPKAFILFALSVLSHLSHAQINFDVKVSDKHLQKVEKSKSVREKLEDYQAFYAKDSIKSAKKAWSTYKKQHKDSLKRAGKWKEVKHHKEAFISGKWKLIKDTLQVDTTLFEPPRDSMDWALQELAKQGEYQKLQEIYEAYGQYDSSYLNKFQPDSMKLDSSLIADRFDLKKRMESYLPPEMAQESNAKIEDQLTHGALDEYGQIQQVDRSGVTEFFKKIPSEEFVKSQLSLKAAKEKYSTVPNLEKKEEGIKRNSLKGSPLKDRFFLNGNIAVQSTDPIIIDANFQIGYRWNKSLSSGVGLLVREQINNTDSTSLTGDAHGFSFFANYDIIKDFFIYGEYQAVKNKSLFRETTAASNWQYATLLGIGRKFRISAKVGINIMLLYDFNYKNNSLNSRPLMPRVGYHIEL